MRIAFLTRLLLLGLIFSGGPALSAAAEKTKDDRVVKDGVMVSLEYTLKSPDGKTLETSKGREPLKYIHGQRMMIPGLEKELTGMRVGGEKHVTVKPEDAYGKLDPKAVLEIPKDKIPANAHKVGATVAVSMTVREVKEKTVVMDLNHPMAGKTLVFDVKIVDIQPPPKPPAAAQPGKPTDSRPKK